MTSPVFTARSFRKTGSDPRALEPFIRAILRERVDLRQTERNRWARFKMAVSKRLCEAQHYWTSSLAWLFLLKRTRRGAWKKPFACSRPMPSPRMPLGEANRDGYNGLGPAASAGRPSKNKHPH